MHIQTAFSQAQPPPTITRKGAAQRIDDSAEHLGREKALELDEFIRKAVVTSTMEASTSPRLDLMALKAAGNNLVDPPRSK